MWGRGVLGRGIGAVFCSVGVDVYAFDGAWATAVSSVRVESLKDFRAGCGEGARQAVRGKNPPGR